ncbi:MAG: hypothetical protein ABEL97_05600 [Salinibacter sp.]
MALDLTGIQNENEFYPSCHLREVLKKSERRIFGLGRAVRHR